MANKHVQVAVTGAAGQIGYALLFRIIMLTSYIIMHSINEIANA